MRVCHCRQNKSVLLLAALTTVSFVFGGCTQQTGEPVKKKQEAIRDEHIQLQSMKSRLKQIRESLVRKKSLGSDRQFVIECAISGDIVNSGVAFVILEQSMTLGDVQKDVVLEAYRERLSASRGMEAVLTIRNLERIIIPNAHPKPEERNQLVSIVRGNVDKDKFGKQETSLAEKIATSQRTDDSVLLVELLLSKHSPSQTNWVKAQLGQKAMINDAKVRELLEFALEIVEKRAREIEELGR